MDATPLSFVILTAKSVSFSFEIPLYFTNENTFQHLVKN